MTIALAAAVVITMLMLIAQLVPVLRFAQVVYSAAKESTDTPQRYTPKVAVILALRGADPFLRECLNGLLRQQYPAYEVLIIIDSENDPARSVVEEVLSKTPTNVPVKVQFLRNRRPTCSLKCSALIEAVSQLRESIEVAAFLDADTIPHPTWLAELVAPLADPTVGVTSGNRWYMPQQATLGSLVRYVWNAGAVVQMYWNRFTWGGSLALCRKVFSAPELCQRWSQSLSTDTVIYGVAKSLRLRTAFVPSILMVNRETCTLGQFFRWVKRQLLVGRLYHPGWPAVLAHGVLTSLVLVATAVISIGLVLLGRIWLAAIGGAVLLAYLLFMLAGLLYLEYAVQCAVRKTGQAGWWIGPATLLKLLIAMPLAQLLNTAGLLAAICTTEVQWRGINYKILPDRSIQMLEYHAFAAHNACQSNTVV